MGKFLNTETIRNIVCQPKTKYDFDDIMDNQKILLVKLPAGVLPENAGVLLGACIVAKLISSAFRRIDKAESERVPFYLYLDEFQRFMNLAADFDTILSETRKYKLVLAGLAHQYSGQLSLKVRQAIFGNVGTMIMFQLGPQDTPTVRSELGEFTASELQSLRLGQAIVKMTGADEAFNLQTYDRPAGEEGELTEQAINYSRQRYCGVPIDPNKLGQRAGAKQGAAKEKGKVPTQPTEKLQRERKEPAEQLKKDKPAKAPKQGETRRQAKGDGKKPTKKPEAPSTSLEQPDLPTGHDNPDDDFV